MKNKLLNKTLIFAQLLGYCITLFFGVSILLLVIQFYYDIKPVLFNSVDAVKNESVVITKEVSLFKTADKSKIYFDKAEIDEIKEQAFISKVDVFTFATFKIKAYTSEESNLPFFRTDMFFECVSDEYLDVKVDHWGWKDTSKVIPLIIPKSYLDLYNFSFAESRNLPVISQNTLSQFRFKIKIYGKDSSRVFDGQIAGFSKKINTILVPKTFLDWANLHYGNPNHKNVSKLLLTFNNPSDKNIHPYFEDNNYLVNNDKLELGKIYHIIKISFVFTFAISLLVVGLSILILYLSFNLIVHKNHELLRDLYLLGFSIKEITFFYRLRISLFTFFSLMLAYFSCIEMRAFYSSELSSLINIDDSSSYMLLNALLVSTLLILAYNLYMHKKIKKIIEVI